MVLAGAKPKDQKVTRTPVVHDWVEVPDVPYEGERPPVGPAPAATKRWWSVVSSMPHCSLWNDGDWQFALDTARIHAAFSRGDMARAQELRVRERVMGTTLDARRDLRIRYVDDESETEQEATPFPNDMTDFQEERRKRLTDAG